VRGAAADASPTPSTMYAPRGVCLTPRRCWWPTPATTGSSSGTRRSRPGPPGRRRRDRAARYGQRGPQALLPPDRSAGRPRPAGGRRRLAPPDPGVGRPGHGRVPATVLVLGQDDLDGVDEGCGPQRFYWPFGVAVVDGAVFVADAGNHRVLAWREPSGGGPEADVVLGQPDPASSFESPYRVQDPPRSASPTPSPRPGTAPSSSPTPRTTGGRLRRCRHHVRVVPVGRADGPGAGPGRPAANGENRWQQVESDSLCWLYGLSWSAGRLGVADSGNNRVMLWGT